MNLVASFAFFFPPVSLNNLRWQWDEKNRKQPFSEADAVPQQCCRSVTVVRLVTSHHCCSAAALTCQRIRMHGMRDEHIQRLGPKPIWPKQNAFYSMMSGPHVCKCADLVAHEMLFGWVFALEWNCGINQVIFHNLAGGIYWAGSMAFIWRETGAFQLPCWPRESCPITTQHCSAALCTLVSVSFWNMDANLNTDETEILSILNMFGIRRGVGGSFLGESHPS